jgi:hypothetical protein
VRVPAPRGIDAGGVRAEGDGAINTLRRALGACAAAHRLEPSEAREWNLTWRASPLDRDGA